MKVVLNDEKAVPTSKKLKKKAAALKGKDFDTLKPAEKDALLKIVLERLDFIDAQGIIK